MDTVQLPDKILELKSVRKSYASGRALFGKPSARVTAVNGVSLTIRQGEFYGVVGASGSGKTTLGRLAVRLERPDKGEIIVNGINTNRLRGKSLKKFRSSVQMICQDPYQSLNPYFSIFHTIEEPLIIHGVGTRSQRLERVHQLLADVGLIPSDDYIHRYPHQLSGGQRQRVAIARAMVLKPAFLVADEPTSMLDPPVSMQIYSLLSHLCRDQGVTFLFITHNIAAAKMLCDTIAVMHNGVVVETGPSQELITSPRSEYTRRLINAQPGFRR